MRATKETKETIVAEATGVTLELTLEEAESLRDLLFLVDAGAVVERAASEGETDRGFSLREFACGSTIDVLVHQALCAAIGGSGPAR